MDLQLKKLRNEAHLKQGELAEKVGTTLRKISAWERGETQISLEDACRVADFFRVTLDELAGRWEYVTTTPARDPDERRLVDAYRSTDARGKGAIMRTAEGEAGVEGQPEAGAVGAA